jgi:hypothetical protein
VKAGTTVAVDEDEDDEDDCEELAPLLEILLLLGMLVSVLI